LDRQIVYAGQQPTADVILKAERAKMVAQGVGLEAILGTSTVVDGLACVPTVPASLAVQVGAGSIYQLANVDATAYGSLPVDLVDNIIKQGIIFATTSLTLTPPGTSGQAVNYLIQAQLQESDTGSTVLPYFNSAQPTVPFSGPAGSGTAQPTVRQCVVALQAKAGVAATAGSQVTPSPDAGWVGLYAVTVANGATALTSGQIAQLTSAPFISVKLPNVPTWVQAGTYLFATDTGTANAIGVTLSPQPSTPPQHIFVKKIASPNTTGMTVTVNGVGTFALLEADGTAIPSGGFPASYLGHLSWDGTSYRLVNGVSTTAVGSLSASSGEGINVAGGGAVSLNFPSLTDNPTVGTGDLFGYYNQADGHHRVLTKSELLTVITAALPGSLLRITPVTSSGTWTRGANTKKALVFATGPGGGGGGGTGGDGEVGAGGGSGGTAIAFVDVSAISSVACTIGTGGKGGYVSGNASIDGQAGSGPTSFGTYAAATAGQGGQGNTSAVQMFGGRPGTGTSGDVLLTGNPGENGNRDCGGNGGASFWGGSGQGIAYLNNAGTGNGFNGTKGGGGGAGDNQGVGSVTGGNGGDGFILVFEFA